MSNNSMKKNIIPEFVVASGLVLLVFITRIPFASQMISAGDSARFAFAMKDYDVTQMHPHAPGYILYVATAKFLDLFINNTRLSLVSLSVLASALVILFLYLLANQMFDASTGVIAGLLLLTSPLFWFNGEVAFPYALEGFLSVFFAFTCYRLIIGEKKWLIVTAIVLGIAAGVRQNSFIFFMPLWLYALKKVGIRNFFIAFLIFGLTCLAWFIPMIVLSGGVQSYFSAVAAQFNTWVLHPASFIKEIRIRGNIFVDFMLFSLGLGMIPLLYYLSRLFISPKIIEEMRSKFLLLWFLPGVFFFIGVNLFNPGHVIVILPPLFIMVAISLKTLSLCVNRWMTKIPSTNSPASKKLIKIFADYKVILVSSALLLIGSGSFIFLFGDTRVSYAAIQKEDVRLSELIRLTKLNFDPEKTIILTFKFSVQAGFYLPDYRIYSPFPIIYNPTEVPIEAQNLYITFQHETNPKTYWIPTGFKIKPIVLPKGIDTVLLWEKQIAKYYQRSTHPLEEVSPGKNNTKIYFFKIKPHERIFYDYHRLSAR